jgi:galactose oxidase-like protein
MTPRLVVPYCLAVSQPRGSPTPGDGDGENWTQVDDIGPNARSESAMAHDAQRQRTVLFGGTDGSAVFNDTWEWNGEDWTQVADSGPAARSEHVIAFDSARNRILLFGGAAGEAALGDTWIWDGNEWVQVENTGPARRQAAAMAFDAVRNRAVLFGGTDGTQTFNDTWEWDGTSWTQVSRIIRSVLIGQTLRQQLGVGRQALDRQAGYGSGCAMGTRHGVRRRTEPRSPIRRQHGGPRRRRDNCTR